LCVIGLCFTTNCKVFIKRNLLLSGLIVEREDSFGERDIILFTFIEILTTQGKTIY